MRKLLTMILLCALSASAKRVMIINPSAGTVEFAETGSTNLPAVLYLNGVLYEPSGDPPEGDPPVPVYTAVRVPLSDPTIPTGAETLPVGFADFDLSAMTTNTAASADTPEVSAWIRENQPGDTMALTAEGISNGASFLFAGEGVAELGAVQKIIERQAAVTLPSTLASNDMVMAWGVNASGFGDPIAINKTELWWIGPDQVVTGETFSVFGRNLILDDAEDCNLWIDGYGWLNSTSANPYKADFVFPTSLTNGPYTVYAHNGHGQQYGWSDPKTISVREPFAWAPDGTWWEVDNTNADGTNDNTAAIQLRIDQTKNYDGRTMYLGPGTFSVSSKLLFNGSGESLRIKGAGMDQTIIQPLNLIDPYKMFNLRMGNVQVEDLTIKAGGFSQSVNDEPLVNVESVSNVHFTRVRLDARHPNAHSENMFRSLNSDHLYFKDCEFYAGRSTWFENTEDVYIDDCQWIGVHDSNNMLGMETSRAYVNNCSAENLDNSDSSDGDGWAKGRWIAGGVRGWNNFYVGDSTTTNMRPRIPTPFYTGTPSAVGTPYVITTNANPDQAVWGCSLTLTNLNRPNLEAGNLLVNMPSNGTGSDRSYEVIDYNITNGVVEFDFLGWEEVFIPEDADLPFAITLKDNVDQNSAEMIMFEGGNTSFRGAVTSATTNTITPTGYDGVSPESDTYGYVAVVAGRGLGQVFRIASIDTGVITIDGTWNVVPDTSSAVAIGKYCDRFVVYNNYLDSVSTPNDYSASVGFQITGSAHDVVMVDNIISEARTVIAASAECQAYYGGNNHVNPQFFNLYLRNDAMDNVSGFPSKVTLRDAPDPYPSDYGLLGNVIRGNTMDGVDNYAYSITGPTGNHVGLTVLQDNTAVNVVDGLDAGDNTEGAVLLGNSFTGDGTGGGVNWLGATDPAIRDLTLTSFATNHVGAAPVAIMQVPIQHFGTNTTTLYCPIYNVGLSSLNWTNILGQSGTIAAGDVGGFSFDATATNTFEVSGAGDTITIHVGDYPAYDSPEAP